MAWDIYHLHSCVIIKSLIDLVEAWINNAHGARCRILRRQTENRDRDRARFRDSSIVALSEWNGIVWQAKTPLDARALLKQGEKREKQKRETFWGFSLRGVGLVTDAWWQMQFSDLSDWCVTARRSCLLPWIQGSAHLSRDQYSPSPGPVSVINLNIKHVSCHTARERHYPMKRALMNRSRRCDDRAAADEPVFSRDSPCSSRALFFFSSCSSVAVKDHMMQMETCLKVPLCYRLFFWQQRVSFLEEMRNEPMLATFFIFIYFIYLFLLCSTFKNFSKHIALEMFRFVMSQKWAFLHLYNITER